MFRAKLTILVAAMPRCTTNVDDLVKSCNSLEFVIPAKAGIQLFQDVLDPGFRRGDAPKDFLRDHQNSKRGGFRNFGHWYFFEFVSSRASRDSIFEFRIFLDSTPKIPIST